MAKPQAVTLVDTGSSPVVHPKLAGRYYPRVNRREAIPISALGIVAVHLAFNQVTGVRFSQGGPNKMRV